MTPNPSIKRTCLRQAAYVERCAASARRSLGHSGPLVETRMVNDRPVASRTRPTERRLASRRWQWRRMGGCTSRGYAVESPRQLRWPWTEEHE